MDDDAFVVVSDLRVPEGSGPVLEAAFAERLGLVDGVDGFVKLEVWRDFKRPEEFRMVTWWRSEEAFRAYMRSREHRESHARIPGDPHKPVGVGVRRYTIVAR